MGVWILSLFLSLSHAGLFMFKKIGGKILNDEVGATAIEYAILLVGIAAVVVAVVYTIGTSVKGLFDTTESNMSASGM